SDAAGQHAGDLRPLREPLLENVLHARRVASGPQRRPAGAHKEGAVRIDARYNAVLPAFDFQTLKMSDGQSLAHLPRFLREKLEKADTRVGVRALPLVKHVALRGTNQHLVNRR